ncbi:MnhB domain-containing protein [Marinobacter daepoensis]|uniref:MnhB domain-containing protein n=1 Tax=Marinobacter daepoensis TaxID=262077 RepID=UPI0003FE7B9E|nr:MnhB domain-containing protein [Marinobacter daepoensis]
MGRLTLVTAGMVFSGVFAGLAWAVWTIAEAPVPVSLPTLVSENLQAAGVEHPVTAVLLNFRSYDTLLEIAVLVIAGIAGISMSRTRSLEDPGLRTSDSLLYALERWFFPVMMLFAGYLLWAGSDRPGGAFQAGSVLAATAVLMRLGGVPMDFLRPGVMLRLGLTVGFSVFLVVALASALDGDVFLQYPEVITKPLIVLIETGLTLSIAMVLLALFVAAPIDPAEELEEGGAE